LSDESVTLIIPVYNEAESLPALLERTESVAKEIAPVVLRYLFVDDGSHDDSLELLVTFADENPRIGVLGLSRNFGHQRAIAAGVDHADSDYMIVMDADGQDPPELIPEIVRKLRDGFDVVHTVRTNRDSDTWFKRASAAAFYWGMRRFVLPDLPRNAGDFKGLSRTAVDALRQYKERVRFTRGIIATIGFRQTEIPYTRPVREQGDSKFSTIAMLRFARDAVFSYSAMPLRLLAGIGALAFGIGIIALVGVIIGAIDAFSEQTQRYLLLATLWLLGGLLLIAFGIIGEYLRILTFEVKNRPLYIVRSKKNV